MAENDIIQKKPKGTKRTLLRLLTYVGKYRYACMAILALCFAGNLLSPLGPKYAGFAILTISINILMTNVSRKIAVNLRQDVFDKLLRLPVSFFYTIRTKKLTQPKFSRLSKAYGKMNGFVEEMITGQKTIQAYTYEEKINQRFDKINLAAADSYYDAEYYGCTIGSGINVINNLGLCLIAIPGFVLHTNSMITLGQISSFVLYSRKFSGPINEIANIMNELYSSLSAAEWVFELLNQEEEPTDAPDALVPEQTMVLQDTWAFQGTHEELIHRKGFYYSLYNAQFS